MRQQDERDLRTALREEADRHRPDREAMLDRINQGRAAYAHRPARRAYALLRPAAAAFAVGVVLVLAVAGVRLTNRGPETDDAPVSAPSAVPTTSAPATTAAPKPSAEVTTATRPPRPPTGTTPPAKTTPPTATPKIDRDGYVASMAHVDPNSNDSWSQGNVVLESSRTLTALELTVEVALTPGVVETGRWSTVSPSLLAVTTSRTNKTLTYRFTLQEGAKLAAGKYTFAVQFNHTAKRSAAEDGYVARVTGEDKDAKVSGGFTPRQ